MCDVVGGQWKARAANDICHESSCCLTWGLAHTKHMALIPILLLLCSGSWTNFKYIDPCGASPEAQAGQLAECCQLQKG